MFFLKANNIDTETDTSAIYIGEWHEKFKGAEEEADTRIMALDSRRGVLDYIC